MAIHFKNFALFYMYFYLVQKVLAMDVVKSMGVVVHLCTSYFYEYPDLTCMYSVSYTHLTLPTIYSV